MSTRGIVSQVRQEDKHITIPGWWEVRIMERRRTTVLLESYDGRIDKN